MKKSKVGEDRDEFIKEVPGACAVEAKAVEFLEKMRWGDHAWCPRCGDANVYPMKNRQGERNARWLWRCRGCEKQYSVRIGSIMEDSAIPLRHWVFAIWAACASKKGVSALQVKRQTGLSYKSALFMMHRVRKAMAGKSSLEKLQGVVEADETYVGGKPRRWGKKVGRGRSRDKAIVFAVVERGGDVRARVVPNVTGATLKGALAEEVSHDATIMTDDFLSYAGVGMFHKGGHHVVRHGKGEFARKDGTHTNTIEGFFSLLKRGIVGTYHCVSRKHLHRYVKAFAFRYSTRGLTDGFRMQALIANGEGCRLTRDELEG